MKKHAWALGYASILVVLVAAMTTGAGALPQSPGFGTIGGQVLGPDGKAISGARVILQASDGRDPQTTETNAQGRFWFPMLSMGLYDLRAYSRGRLSEWRQNVWVQVGRQTTVTLHLRSKKAKHIEVAPQATGEAP
jgi:hypothetical protein